MITSSIPYLTVPLLFLFLSVLPCHATQLREHCVLKPDGTTTCNHVPLLMTTLRIGRAPCLKLDMPCWSLRAMHYTNAIRQRFKVKRMLIPGPLRQLDNAIRYARVLHRRGRLRHQNLRRVTKEVKCKRWIGGENIAYNYATGDVAKACVLQWLHSKTHRENLVRPWFREVVIGFHFGRSGRVYCVQTFGVVHNFGTFGGLKGRRCERVSRRGKRRKWKRRKAKRKRKRRKGWSNRIRDQGNRACRCIELGKKCWFSLRQLSGNRCKPFRRAGMQPRACKWVCCRYCRFFPYDSMCRKPVVRRQC
eukprot:GFKZ01016151.1.p1 GENE.GFKZ01016151.1~~GFKZ01016151.1.p1  ORF type:complete len:305 (+),score=10.52 GFKZ01016151.1:1040-1954(+)